MIRENVGLIENIKVHAELIAAIMAGLFILLAWRLDTNDQTTASVLFIYCCFLCVGGFAKAKEGIEETIKEKKLNVELLMILAAIGSAGYYFKRLTNA
ncbi:Heavy metal translocating P-type ATPase OS=Lysinibacillus sphaericus OX=1421 GN=LS41612_03510 PE=3 SV=1 [Lysinibacillus sphaericus]